MKTAHRTLAQAEEVWLGPALLMPSLLSFFAALLAWALTSAGVRSTGALGIVTTLQALLMLTGAGLITGLHTASAACWQRRVAPSTALWRVRQASRTMLARLALRGVIGPLLMLVGLAWLRPAADVLVMAAAVLLALGAPLLVGAALGSRLQRRVSTWVERERKASLRWRWPAWERRWRFVPCQEHVGTSRHGHGLWVVCVLVPQSLIQAQYWSFHAWGRVYGSGLDLLFVGLWVLLLGLLINMATLAPPLHWRLRLAPGGLSAGGWAGRLVAGSLLSAAGWVSIALLLSMSISSPSVRAMQLAAWGPALADVLLAMAWTLWMRGLRNSGLRLVAAGFGLAVVVIALAAAAAALGQPLQRGPALLVAELTLTAGFAVAAQRAWARQDLNRLAPRA